MEKIYTAGTSISINVKMGDKHCHLQFVPRTVKGSYFVTSDEKLQQAIEAHPRFGKTIHVEERVVEPVRVVEEAPEDPNIHVKAGSLAEAKDALAERFGISRSKMRSKADIEKAAAANHVVFDWE